MCALDTFEKFVEKQQLKLFSHMSFIRSKFESFSVRRAPLYFQLSAWQANENYVVEIYFYFHPRRFFFWFISLSHSASSHPYDVTIYFRFLFPLLFWVCDFRLSGFIWKQRNSRRECDISLEASHASQSLSLFSWSQKGMVPRIIHECLQMRVTTSNWN